MSVPCKSERTRLSHDEFELIRRTHHPAIYELSSHEMQALKSRIESLQGRAEAANEKLSTALAALESQPR